MSSCSNSQSLYRVGACSAGGDSIYAIYKTDKLGWGYQMEYYMQPYKPLFSVPDVGFHIHTRFKTAAWNGLCLDTLGFKDRSGYLVRLCSLNASIIHYPPQELRNKGGGRFVVQDPDVHSRRQQPCRRVHAGGYCCCRWYCGGQQQHPARILKARVNFNTRATVTTRLRTSVLQQRPPKSIEKRLRCSLYVTQKRHRRVESETEPQKNWERYIQCTFLLLTRTDVTPPVALVVRFAL